MSRLLTSLVLLPILLAAPDVSAQSWSENAQSTRHVQSAPLTAFVRFSPQPNASRSTQAWQYGLSFAGTRQQSRAYNDFSNFGNDEPTSGFEVRLARSDLGLWSRGGDGQLLASFNATYDKLNARETTGAKKGNIGNVLLIGAAVVGGIVLIAAASGDNAPLSCSGNTVPNPIKGTCEPI